jgi:3-phosphoshikimate 1-carboxyvinyltransferase
MPLPDLIEIVPLDKPVRAEITVPGSKSITNRALILAALADGEVTLEGALWSEDTQVMTEALRKLGFEIKIEPDPEEFCNRRITVKGLGGRIPNAGTPEKPLELFVGNAGTAARFLSALVCLGNGVYRLSGVPRMHERPQAALFNALRELGYRVETEAGNEKLPVRILGSTPSPRPLPEGEGGRRPGEGERPRTCTVRIEDSSQFASALLLCARHGGWDVKVIGENAEESPYVAMTGKLLEAFPNCGGKFQIEPDASSGSYFKAAEELLFPLTPEEATKIIAGDPNDHSLDAWFNSNQPWQIDSAFIRAWEQIMRAGEISRKLHLGDSIMTAIVVAPLGNREKKFTDLGRLRIQECERVVALRTELTKCGAKVIEEGDTLTVYPSKLHGAEIETYNDHRMAMCFAILGLKVSGIKIKNPACVKKTFPNFFQKLATPPPKGLGAEIRDAKTGRKLGVDELFAE